MFIKAVRQKTSAVIITVCILILCAGVMIYSEECSKGAVNGIKLCLSVLVPSLFPFMAISSFIVKSGISSILGRPFEKIMQKVFGLNGCCAPTVVLSLIGGYPVGAKGISTLYESKMIDEHTAKKASLFAVCSGPGFLINFVGMSIYHSRTIGVIILVSQIISVILLGIFINLFDKSKTERYISKSEYKNLPLSNAVVESTLESANGIMIICAFVVLFSAFCQIINSLITDGIFKNLILCFLEVCTAVSSSAESCPIETIAFAVGFGGICVHFQIYSALGKIKINKLSFFCIRIIQGTITAVLTHLGLCLFKTEAPVFSTSTAESIGTSGGTIISGAALVAVMLCFLYTLKNYKAN